MASGWRCSHRFGGLLRTEAEAKRREEEEGLELLSPNALGLWLSGLGLQTLNHKSLPLILELQYGQRFGV